MNSIIRSQVVYTFVVACAIALGVSVLPLPAFAQFSDDGGCCDYFDTATPSYDFYDTATPYYDYYDTATPYYDYYDTATPSYDFYDTASPNYDVYDTASPNYDVIDTASPNYDVFDTASPNYSYIDYEYVDYLESGYAYSSSPSYASSYPSQPFSFAPPSYSSPTPYPRPTPQPAPQPRPQQQQQQQQQQQLAHAQPININNVNTNTNVNTNVAPVTPVYQAPVTYPVQYVYPQYPTYPTYPTQNLYCTITVGPSSIQSGQMAYLSWTSSGAYSAWLSDGIGAVAVNGSLAVRPNVSKTYTLTVTGQGGTRTCTAYVNVSGYAPYVSLSQIPYTGFDLGPIGNAMYWVSLIAFAAAGAYLLIYFKGGALALAGQAFAGSILPVRAKREVRETRIETPVAIAKTEDPMQNLPVAASQSTIDTMLLARSKGKDAPRIVITRN